MSPISTNTTSTNTTLTNASFDATIIATPPGVRAFFTLRRGGFSGAGCPAPDAAVSVDPAFGGDEPSPHAQRATEARRDPASHRATPIPGLNLGLSTGDDPATVRRNRALVASACGRPVSWLKQIHGTRVHVVESGAHRPCDDPPVEADASVTIDDATALAVQVADCLPVLLWSTSGSVVGAAHAGWRGLCAGVLEAAVDAMRARQPDSAAIECWLGPCIGQSAFEVGEEVRDAFLRVDAGASIAFVAGRAPGKWHADLHRLARARLEQLGVHVSAVDGGCTFSEPHRYWSHRRNPRSGRMAALIWRSRDAA